MKPYYEEAGITIYHGDCREILPTLPKVDLVLTDPPYGIGFAAQPTKWQRLAGKTAESWDDITVDGLLEICSIGRIQVIWGGNYYPLPPSRGWLCWYKPDAPPSMASFELAWTNQDRNARMFNCSISQTNPERVGHPTQKPLALIAWCLSQFPDVKTCIDPFMGSGTTLVACKKAGIQCIGIERKEKYCEIAAKRLAQGVLWGAE